ncbi:hypothetical protein EZV62_005566 [Acer yangbiense]|uniref:DUF4283 domain-containing protein n=1 Tax=Acer yangbiense TaxID=1000413 RepID=A0A5C7IMZ7_9ROSI|nr:hypothetical protein EZV62_005566 [Acer yangbiense]
MMNAEEVAKLCEALTLKEKEGPLMQLQEGMTNKGEKRLALRLAGKLLSSKPVNRDAFMAVMPKIWVTIDGFDIEIIDGNTFSFTFKNEKDQLRILNRGPWSFDKALLVLVEPKGKGDTQDMSFNRVAFWVQIHRVPLICMTSEIGRAVGNMIGEVKEIDDGGSGDYVGKYIRVRVIIDINQPLRHILRVDVLRDGKESTMLLRYERLLEHCFRYGTIGHVVRDYFMKATSTEPEDFNLLYGPWLRASSPERSSNNRGKKEEHSRRRNSVVPLQIADDSTTTEVSKDTIPMEKVADGRGETSVCDLGDEIGKNREVVGIESKARKNLSEVFGKDDLADIKKNSVKLTKLGGADLEVGGNSLMRSLSSVCPMVEKVNPHKGMGHVPDKCLGGGLEIVGPNTVGCEETYSNPGESLDKTWASSIMDVDGEAGIRGRGFDDEDRLSVAAGQGVVLSAGPNVKTGKWKMWARDGFRTCDGPPINNQLGKRSTIHDHGDAIQDSKFAKNGDDMLKRGSKTMTYHDLP